MLTNRSLSQRNRLLRGMAPLEDLSRRQLVEETFVSKVTDRRHFGERKWWKNELEVSTANVRFRSLESGLLKFTTEGINRSIG
ncbi:MAG: hypothetical protein ACTS6A_01660 [Candidatus Hodgkinia cicadicola]